jgi:nitroreductase
MVRSFTDEPLDPEVVDRLLDTARRGPSAGYSQGVEFVVVTDTEKRSAIAAPHDAMFAVSGHHNFLAQAPVHVVICVSPEMYRSRYREADKMRVRSEMDDETLWVIPWWFSDAGAALTLLLLAAVDEGVAAAFVGANQIPFLGELLGVPDDYVPVGIALLGHEAPDARQFGDVSAKPRRRRPLSEVVHYDRW